MKTLLNLFKRKPEPYVLERKVLFEKYDPIYTQMQSKFYAWVKDIQQQAFIIQGEYTTDFFKEFK